MLRSCLQVRAPSGIVPACYRISTVLPALRKLFGFTALPAQLTRPGVGGRTAGAAWPLVSISGTPEMVSSEFLLAMLKGIWERLEQLQRLGEVADSLDIRRALAGAASPPRIRWPARSGPPRYSGALPARVASRQSQEPCLQDLRHVDGTAVGCSATD